MAHQDYAECGGCGRIAALRWLRRSDTRHAPGAWRHYDDDNRPKNIVMTAGICPACEHQRPGADTCAHPDCRRCAA